MLVAWTIRDLARREAEQRAESERAEARLVAAESARAAAAARGDALARALEAARADVAEARAALAAAAGDRPRLEAELAASEARVASLLRSIHRRDAEIDRLLGGAPERTLADLAAMPGFRASGHLLWHPAQVAALLYAFGLPRGRPYRIELQLDDGRIASGPAFEVGADGDAVVPIRLPVVGARIRGTTVVRDPGGQTVLGARLGGG